MRNSYYYVLQALYSALNGQVVVDGDTIPVYSSTPSNLVQDYIYLGEHTRVDWGGAGMWGTEETLTVQIISREDADYPDKTRVNQIADLVLQTLKPSYNSELSVDNFACTGFHLDNQMNDYALGENETYNRIILVFRYYLTEEIQILSGIGWMRIGTTFIVT